jgi:hypothetical protein
MTHAMRYSFVAARRSGGWRSAYALAAVLSFCYAGPVLEAPVPPDEALLTVRVGRGS